MKKPETESLKFEDLMSLAIEAPQSYPYLVDGLLPEEGVSILCSKPKCGKTSLALQLAVDVAEGSSFLGRATAQGDSLYFYLEGPRNLPGMRAPKLGYTGNGGQVLIRRESMAQGNLDERIKLLHKALQERPKTRLVVLDTLPKFIRLADMDRYDQVLIAMEAIERTAKQFHTHILCLVHAKKFVSDDAGDSVLGSTAFRGATDTNLFLTKKGNDRIISTEQRIGEPIEPTILNFDRETFRLTLGPTVDSVEEQRHEQKKNGTRERIETDIREALVKSPGLTTRDLLERVTGKNKTILDVLDAMERQKKVTFTNDSNATRYEFAMIPLETAA